MKYQISKDDIEDILQTSKEIETSIAKIVEDFDLDIAFSATFRAVFMLMLHQSENVKEMIEYRHALTQLIDTSITYIALYGMPKDIDE